MLPTPALALAALVAGAAPKPGAAPPPPTVKAEPFGPAAPLAAADRAFDVALAAKDRATFSGLVDERAIFGSPTGMVEGRAAVVASWERWLAPKAPSLRWAPERAVVATSGDLGYTIGRWHYTGKDKDGRTVEDEGRYLTVWRKGADGAWRACFDLSWEPPKPGAELSRKPTAEIASSAGDLVARTGTWTGPGGAHGGFLTLLRRQGEHGRLVPEADTVVRIGK